MTDIPKTYEPKEVEQKWYSFWMEKGYFHADDVSDKPPYSIVIPPPNVTGVLHKGHAVPMTLQDILIRWKRMQGHNTLWMPGTDHSGISANAVVERKLVAEEGVNRFQIGREKFIEKMWEWKDARHQDITDQLMRLGSSLDWPRERFTLDEGLSRGLTVDDIARRITFNFNIFGNLWEQVAKFRAARKLWACIQGRLYYKLVSVLSDNHIKPGSRLRRETSQAILYKISAC